jgi:hypothetical protein
MSSRLKTKEIADSFSFEVVFDKTTGKKSLKMASETYFSHFLYTKAKVGDKGTMILTFKKPSRSQSQLRYHMTLCGLIGNHTGYTTEEVHDAVMRIKNGTKVVSLGGFNVHVRDSVAEKAKFPKQLMAEMIEFDLDLCRRYEIKVPTAEELGYVSNNIGYKPAFTK